MTHETNFQRWFREGTRQEGDPIPAATVVLVREAANGLEALMLKKNSKLAFGGMWVFPGGRIDEGDWTDSADIEDAARRAAVREAAEEAALIVDQGSLAFISHWTPPNLAPKRFATWFFVAPAPAGAVTIDMGEIHEEAWMRPADALTRRDLLEIELAPPTWVTLRYLADFADLESLMADAHAREPEYFLTAMSRNARGMASLWAGDAAYESGDLDAPGPRNRLWMEDSGWTLERD